MSPTPSQEYCVRFTVSGAGDYPGALEALAGVESLTSDASDGAWQAAFVLRRVGHGWQHVIGRACWDIHDAADPVRIRRIERMSA